MEKRLFYTLLTPYKCKLCGQEMLFFVTQEGILIDYKEFINNMASLQEMIDMLTHRRVRFLKCLCCDKMFIIDWSHGWPQQLLDIRKLQDFGMYLPKPKR